MFQGRDCHSPILLSGCLPHCLFHLFPCGRCPMKEITEIIIFLIQTCIDVIYSKIARRFSASQEEGAILSKYQMNENEARFE